MTVYQHVLPGMQADAVLMFSDTVFGHSMTGARATPPESTEDCRASL